MQHAMYGMRRAPCTMQAINQPVLDMPEVLWKAYIDFEIAEEE